MRKMERALANQERLLARWGELGGERAESEARTHLSALGLDDDALSRPTRELSGGQRKLVALAACLARRPGLLLLDEPEAHLDMNRRDALEQLIDGFDGAVLMVSHDRHLLDECVDAIAELDRGRIRIWPGAYSAYTVARRLELERQQQQWVTQRKEIARLEEAVRRFRHWAHITVNERARQAGARQAAPDRLDGEDRAAGVRAAQDGARAAQLRARRPARRRARGRRLRVRRGPGAARRRARDHARRARRRRRAQRRRQDRPRARAGGRARAALGRSAGSARASRSATSRRRRATSPASSR